LISNICSKFFNRILPYRTGAFLSILVVALYTLLVGARPPVVRAALMGIISIPASLIGRKAKGIPTLGITAACMAFFNPFVVWDVSFQLSSCATFGILMFTDFLAQKASALLNKSDTPAKKPLLLFLNDFVITTFAAQIAIFPILAMQFEEFSLITPLVNFLILPLQPFLMVLGGAALFCGFFFLPFGRLMGLTVWFVAAFNDKIVLLFSLIPLSIKIKSLWGFWISLLLNILLATVVISRKSHSPSQPEAEQS